MSPAPSRLPVWAVAALMLLCALAVYFRLSDLGARDLWTDEAWVALAALKPTPGAALAAGQSTPPLYLLSVWAAAQLWGGREAVLRLVSFLFGVGTIFLVWRLARSLVSLPGALAALAAVAVSPVLVYYAKELKQYSGDAFLAVLIFYLAERLRAKQGERGWTALALAGALGLGFSHALVFVLPVAAMVLWFGLPRRRRPGLVLLAAAWGLAFTAYYLTFFRREVDPQLVAYWQEVGAFPDFTGATSLILWLGRGLYEYFWYFLGGWGLYWGPPLLVAGAWTLVQQRRGRLLIYLLGPLLLAFAAATLHRYPFMARCGGNRLMLFSAPGLYLVVATGGVAVFTWLWRRRQQWLACGLTVLLLLALHPVENFRENLHPLNNREQIQPLVASLECLLKPGDLVYVYYFAVQPFEYYSREAPPQVCLGKSCVEQGLEAAAGDSPPRRIWLLASHFEQQEDVRRFAGGLLGPQWQETGCLTRTGAVLYRFEPKARSVAARPVTLPEPGQSGSPTPPLDKAY